MLEDSVSSVPSIWTSVSSWFTPTVLFVLLNLVIGTIFFTSNRKQQQNPQNPDQQQQTKFGRSPSVLHHLKSFKLYLHYPSPDSQTHYQHAPSPAAGNSEETETVHESQDPHFGGDTTARGLEEEFNRVEEPQIRVARTKSDAEPASGVMPEKLPTKLRKSASTMSAFSHFEEEDIVESRRPATVREGKVTEGDEEVDAKADDFINRFKQQLKLQRLDSILRYKETIVRGTGK